MKYDKNDMMKFLIHQKLTLQYKLKTDEIEINIDENASGIILNLDYNRIKYYKIPDESFNNKKYELIRHEIIEYIQKFNYKLVYENMNYNNLNNIMIFQNID